MDDAVKYVDETDSAQRKEIDGSLIIPKFITGKRRLSWHCWLGLFPGSGARKTNQDSLCLAVTV